MKKDNTEEDQLKDVKIGDRILAYNEEDKLYDVIFLSYTKGAEKPLLTVAIGDEDNYNKGNKFRTKQWEHYKILRDKKFKVSKADIAKLYYCGEEDIELLQLKDIEDWLNKKYIRFSNTKTEDFVINILKAEIYLEVATYIKGLRLL